MKRFLSLALTLAMLLTSFSFAAPVPTPVAVEEATEEVVVSAETTQEQAVQLAEVEGETTTIDDDGYHTEIDVSTYGDLVLRIEFDDYEAGTTFANITSGNINAEWNPLHIKAQPKFVHNSEAAHLVGEIVADSNGGNYLNVKPGSDKSQTWLYNRLVMEVGAHSFEERGDYRLVFDFKRHDENATAVKRCWGYFGVDSNNSVNPAIKTGITTTDWVTAYSSGAINPYVNTVTDANGRDTIAFINCETWGNNAATWSGTHLTAAELSYDIDNICIYFAPSPTVTFDNGGEETVTVPEPVSLNNSGATIDLNDTAYLASSSDDNKLFLGWSTVEGDGTKILRGKQTITGDTTYYAIFRDKKDFEKLTQYGSLVMSEDFEFVTKAIDGGQTRISYFNPILFETLVQNSDNYPEMHANDANVLQYKILQEENGNKFVRSNYFGDVPNIYVKFRVEFPNLTTEGRYTYVVNYKVADKNDLVDGSLYLKAYTDAGNSHAGNRYTIHNGCNHTNDVCNATSWKQAVTQLYVNPELVNAGYKGDDPTKIYSANDVFIYTTATGTTNGKENYEYDIDNLAVYYEPVRKISFDANGMEGVTVPETKKIYGYEASHDFSTTAYYPTMPANTEKGFEGWSTTADGKNLVTASTKYSQDTTLYAVYKPISLHPYLCVEFEEGKGWRDYFSGDPGYGSTIEIMPGDETSNGAFARVSFPKTVDADITPLSYSNVISPASYAKNISRIIIRARIDASAATEEDLAKYGKNISLYLNGVKNGLNSSLSIGENWRQHFLVTADGQWKEYVIDVDSVMGANLADNTTFTSFRFDLGRGIPAGLVFDCDYIRFVLKDDVVVNRNLDEPFTMTATNADGSVDSPLGVSDYRSGYFKLTYPETVDIATVKSDVGETLFKPDSVRAFDNEGKVWLVNAKANLTGNTFTVPTVNTEALGIITYRQGYSYKFTPIAFNDGENLIPNGDFSNPDYNSWVISQGSSKIVNEELEVTFKAIHNTAQSLNIVFKENTKYYFISDMRYDCMDEAAYNGSLSFYSPFQHGEFGGTQNGSVGSTGTNIFFNQGGRALKATSAGKTQVRSGVIYIRDDAYYTNLSESYSLSAGIISFYTNQAPGTGHDSVTYYLDNVVVKEMFPVVFDANGGEGELTVDFVKGESIKIPTNVPFTKAGSVFVGYEINGVVYQPGDSFTSPTFGSDTVTAKVVWATHYATDATGAVTKDVSDYRTGYFKVVFDAPTTLDVAKTYFTDSFFAQESIQAVADTENKVFIASANASVIGKTWSKFGYKFTMQQFNDGENLISNGDLSNPYYNPFFFAAASNGGIVNNELKVNVTAQHNTVRYKNIKFKADTEYFISADMRYDYIEDETNCYPLRDNGTIYNIDLYVPAQAAEQLPHDIVGVHQINKDKSGVVQNRTGFVSIKNQEYYASIEDPKEGVEKVLTDSGCISFYTGFIPETGKQVTYYLDNIVLKEMFPVTVISDGTETTQVIWLAKDEEVKLPETTLTKDYHTFVGYEIDGEIYEAGETFTATQFNQAIEINAVWVDNSAPTTYDLKEIRTNSPAGIRFTAEVTYEQDQKATEFGFMVTRQHLMDVNGMGTATNENFTKANLEANEVAIVWGKSKYTNTAGNTVYVVHEEKGDLSKVFTGVLTGIPTSAYADVLVARPYVLDVDGNYHYGDVISSDIMSIAQSFKDNETSYYHQKFETDTTQYEKHQEFVACIDAIIAGKDIPALNPKQN